ncbi:MAG: hypothetical protein EXS10_08430 [Phycisphaerales bacterium]|nr:hypothetical protein [Phycisphaerales bacterium]
MAFTRMSNTLCNSSDHPERADRHGAQDALGSKASNTETPRMDWRANSTSPKTVEVQVEIRVEPRRVSMCAAPPEDRPIHLIPALAPTVAAEPSQKEDSSRQRAAQVHALVSAYYSRVHAFVRKHAAVEVADDVTQEVFFCVIKLRNLEMMTLEVGYFLRIADNLLKRRAGQRTRFQEVLRQSGRVGPQAAEFGTRGTSRSQGDSFEAAANANLGSLAVDAEALGQALCALPSHLSAAVRMIVCDGLSYEAAAKALAVPASTVNNWKHRGLQRLKQFIEASNARIPHASAAASACLAPRELQFADSGWQQGNASRAPRRSRSLEGACAGRALAANRSSVCASRRAG